MMKLIQLLRLWNVEDVELLVCVQMNHVGFLLSLGSILLQFIVATDTPQYVYARDLHGNGDDGNTAVTAGNPR